VRNLRDEISLLQAILQTLDTVSRERLKIFYEFFFIPEYNSFLDNDSFEKSEF